jgi:ATP-binding cassette subfamily B protein RaxB
MTRTNPADSASAINFSGRHTVPLMLQSEHSECGMTCVAMIANYFGRGISVSELRRRFGSSSRGTSLKFLMRVADSLGLSSRPVRLEIEGIRSLRVPSVLHWDLDHYVVLSKISKNRVQIQDPAQGTRWLTLSELSRSFTGVALELYPAENFTRREKVEKVALFDLWSHSEGMTKSLFKIFSLSMLLEVFSLTLPIVNQLVIDHAVARGDLNLLTTIILGGALVLLLQVATNILRGFLQLHFSTFLTFQMKSNLLRHVLRLPLAWFESRRLGDILSRFRSVEYIQSVFSDGIVTSIIDGIMSIATFALLIIYSPFLSGVVLGSLLVFIFVRTVAFPYMRRLAAEGINYQARQDSVLIESIRGIRAFKLFGNEIERHAIWQNSYVETVNNNIKIQKATIYGMGASSFLASMSNLLLYFLGARAVINGELSLGMLMAFISFRGQFWDSALSVVGQLYKFRMTSLHLERLADIVHSDPEPGIDMSGELAGNVRGEIVLSEVSFRYSEQEPWILDQINLTIESGAFIALVGPSGGGKSTLIKLLTGLYRPSAGKVYVDGNPLDSMGLRAFRNKVGIVMQDDQLFAGTVEDNIAFFTADVDSGRVEEVAKLSMIHDEIMAMPMGYRTYIGDLGSTLSGGQKQRLLLARALYPRPKILILDEGTANLDWKSEQNIISSIEQLPITRVIATHQMKWLERVDNAYSVFDGLVAKVELPGNEV